MLCKARPTLPSRHVPKRDAHRVFAVEAPNRGVATTGASALFQPRDACCPAPAAASQSAGPRGIVMIRSARAAIMFEGLRFKHWKTSQDDSGIVTLVIDRESAAVNAISRAMLDELDEIVERLEIDNPPGVVIHSAKAAGFAVGADVHELAGMTDEAAVREHIEYGQRVLQRLASVPCPTVAAIHGNCLGGGTELVLACRHRVAVAAPDTRIGLPEVMLGIHPGWGGSARLPRLIGAPAALQAMLTGKPFSADKARGAGLVDRVVPEEQLLAAARQLAVHPRKRAPGQRCRAWASNWWPVRQALAPMIRRQTAAKVRREHYPAPFALIEVW